MSCVVSKFGSHFFRFLAFFCLLTSFFLIFQSCLIGIVSDYFPSIEDRRNEETISFSSYSCTFQSTILRMRSRIGTKMMIVRSGPYGKVLVMYFVTRSNFSRKIIDCN